MCLESLFNFVVTLFHFFHMFSISQNSFPQPGAGDCLPVMRLSLQNVKHNEKEKSHNEMSRRDSRGVSGSTSASPPLLQLQRQMGSLPAWEGPLGTTTSCEQQEPTACTQRRGTYLQVTVTPAKQAAPACQARHQTEEEPRLCQSSCARQVFPAGALQPACMERKKNH